MFEEHMDGLDLVKDDLNDDTLYYYCEKSYCSSSEYESEYDYDVASDDVDKKVFDKVVIEDQHTPCTKFYDGHSNVKTNLFSDCEEPFEDLGLVSDFDIDDMCEYKLEQSFEYNLTMHKDTHLQGMCDPFPHVDYEAFIFEIDSMHDSSNKENSQF